MIKSKLLFSVTCLSYLSIVNVLNCAETDRLNTTSDFRNFLHSELTRQINLHQERMDAYSYNLEHSSESYGRHIHDFKGPVYQRGDLWYDVSRNQYASSSYPSVNTSPFLIAYPLDTDDVIKAIQYSKTMKKNIVTRSGGHQYCGQSSGAEGTIVLSMNQFNVVQKKNNGLIEVGPAVRLIDINQFLANCGLSIPHGECPFVCIGGHAQTGGYGHTLRSFGLNADYVQEFDIILSDANLYTIIRPKPDDDNAFNRELFYGVLSGNAGSFGVVTRYVYDTVKDLNHPCSYGFSQTRKYNTAVFQNLMKYVKQWTQLIAAEKDDHDLKGLDFMMSLESGPFSQYEAPLSLVPSLMIVELVYSDPEGNAAYNGQFDNIINDAKDDLTFEDKLVGSLLNDFEGNKKLSAMAHQFVRKFPLVTFNGREFSLPYKKRINVTMNALNDEFLKHFVDQIDKTMNTEHVHLVFQMAFGGGAYRTKGKDSVTGFPHRTAVYNFVYDLFYEDGYEQKAIELQDEMGSIVQKYFNDDAQEKRYFWGTFGDIDMSKGLVQDMYYDNSQEYQRLQKLKKKHDPFNIFRSDLTITLPTT